jgi:ankyrin repeat protein
MLDWYYDSDGRDVLRRMLEEGADPNARKGAFAETPLHVATRRRRMKAVEILLDHGADIDATTSGGKTAFAHAVRRGFDDLAGLLESRGASTELNDADRFAVAVVSGRLEDAKKILSDHPGVARTGNPEEDRLLADVAGREASDLVEFLIGARADLAARGVDDGTALHQAAWFGRPDNARLLIGAGAPLDVFDAIHESSPIGWAAHGSRFSGGADQRQEAYVALARLLLDAGSCLYYPDDANGERYLRRMMGDASPQVRKVFVERA